MLLLATESGALYEYGAFVLCQDVCDIAMDLEHVSPLARDKND